MNTLKKRTVRVTYDRVEIWDPRGNKEGYYHKGILVSQVPIGEQKTEVIVPFEALSDFEHELYMQTVKLAQET